MGVYIGTVLNTADVNFSGRLDVQIPSLQVTNDQSDRALEKITYTVRYCSPFAGQTPARDAKGNPGFESTQKSYGFWAVPPDIGTQVLVMFANGNVNEGFWIGCVPDMQINHMVPGLASSEKSIEERKGGGQPPKFGNLGISDLPVAEVNRKVADGALTINSDYTEDKSAAFRPVHTHIAETLLAQGLIKDKIRGVTSSSARRETPSQVFGISTPGPIDHKGQFAPQNTEAVNRHGEVGGKFAHSRLGGHSFVMDDGTPSVGGETPIENELIRFRTRKGAQVLLHDSENTVYIINSTGTAWVELSEDGKIDMYADESFSVHTIGDFNLRAERDINIEAARNINIKATGQNKNDEATGGVNETINSNENIITGRIHMDAKDSIEMIAEIDIRAKAGEDIEMFAGKDFAIKSEEQTILEAQKDLRVMTREDFMLYVTDSSNIEIGSSSAGDSTGIGNLNVFIKNDIDMTVGRTVRKHITTDNILSVGADNKVFAGNDHLVNTGNEIHFNTSGKVASTVYDTAQRPAADLVGDLGERVPVDVVIQLDTYENLITPDPIDPADPVGLKRQSIMKRVPTAEPYAEHENVRKVLDEESGALKEDGSGIIFTDRELKDERFSEEEEEAGALTGPAELGATTAGADAISGAAGTVAGGAAGVIKGAAGTVAGGAAGAISGAVGGGADFASIAGAVSTATKVIAVGPTGIISEGSKIVSAGLGGGADFGTTTSQFSDSNLIKGGGGYLTDGKGNVVTRGQGYTKFGRKGK